MESCNRAVADWLNESRLVTVSPLPRFKSFCVFFGLTASGAVATGSQKSSFLMIGKCMVNVKMLNVVSNGKLKMPDYMGFA